jgi:hypothetical protein
MAIELDRTVISIRNCVYNIRRQLPGMSEQIVVLSQGRSWRFDPAVPPSSVRSSVSQRDDRSVNGLPPSDAAVDTATRVTTAQPVRPATSATPAATTTTAAPARKADVAVPATHATRYFEELGENEDGDVIVIDEEAKPYKLVPLDDVGDVH